MSNKLVLNYDSQIRALKLRISPTEIQKLLINKTFGCCRLVYNTSLFESNQFYENIIKPEPDKNIQKLLWKTFAPTSQKQFKEKYEFLNEVSSQALCQSLNDLNQAKANFFKSLKKEIKGKQRGSPKFKSKKTHEFSYRENMPSETAFNPHNKIIKIPKLGEVKFRHGQISDFFLIEGTKLKSITVRKNSCDQYYAVLLFEREYTRKPKVYSEDESKTIGLDFSPAKMYIDSNNQPCQGYIPQKQNHSKLLKKFQRKWSRTKPDSKNREKARVRVARIERHIANSRLDFIEKESLRLVRNYEIIGIEDLNLIGISKFLKNARNVADVSWATFVSKLEWKAQKNENNCQIIKVSRWYPSSKTCNSCGHIYSELKLSDRLWTCPKCGAEIERDFNAACNLKQEALRIVGQELPEYTSMESDKDFLSVLAHSALGLNEVEKNGREAIREDSTF